MLLPYAINRILSNKDFKLYYLECDIIHPLIPLNYCISLININKPIITNVPILLKEDSYQLIKSIYIRNTYIFLFFHFFQRFWFKFCPVHF